MKKILVICHIDKNKFDGQQSKTNDVISCFKRNGYDVEILNYGKRFILPLLVSSFRRIKSHNNILIMPGGKKALFLYSFISRFFKYKNFYYLAVGGWVTDLIQNESSKRKLKPLKKFKLIVLQNKESVRIFKEHGFTNTYFIPTFSSKAQLSDTEFKNSLVIFEQSDVFRFCFFARIEESKGVFEACNAIKKLSSEGYKVELDIYGQIQKKELEPKLNDYLDNNVRYLGVVHDDAIKILSSYYCMLFPTYYRGEGMAHSIIESFMAGLPVIATDWKYNSELVTNNETGFLINVDNLEENLYNKIKEVMGNKELIKKMRTNCFLQSKQYNSDIVLEAFIDKVDELS